MNLHLDLFDKRQVVGFAAILQLSFPPPDVPPETFCVSWKILCFQKHCVLPETCCASWKSLCLMKNFVPPETFWAFWNILFFPEFFLLPETFLLLLKHAMPHERYCAFWNMLRFLRTFCAFGNTLRWNSTRKCWNPMNSQISVTCKPCFTNARSKVSRRFWHSLLTADWRRRKTTWQ